MKKPGNESLAYPRTVLAMLLLVYSFNFADRQIVSILAQPIKADLGLSDSELGLMGGLAFAILYTTLGIPAAAIADRKGKARLISWALAIWSAFTALCGLASNFWTLFLARMGVGIGEAGGVAPSYALIADYFPRSHRGRALGLFSMGIPLGSAAGIYFGSWLATHLNWRVAFLTLGLTGLAIVPVFRWIVRDTRAKPGDAVEGQVVHPPLAPSLRRLLKKPTFWLIALGSGATSFVGYGLGFWVPSYVLRSFDATPAEIGGPMALAILCSGIVGVYLGGLLGDYFGSRDVRNYPLVLAGIIVLVTPLAVIGIASDKMIIAIWFLTAPNGLSLAWIGPAQVCAQSLVPPSLRGTASAAFLLISNLLGLSLGPYAIGAISDRMMPHYGELSLRYSLTFAIGVFLLALILYLFAFLTIRRDWYQEGSTL